MDEEGWSDYPSLFAQFCLSYFPKSGKILELGAGLGGDSRYFTKHGFRVTSTDISNEALHISQWESLNQKLQIDYINLDIRNPIPLENESYDVVFSHAVLQYFDNLTTQKIVDEVFRILLPEGVFATLLKSKDDPIIAQSEKVDEIFYKTPTGLLERFYSEEEFSKFIKGKFESVILDSTGQTMENEHDTFLRFIGKKLF